MVYVCNEPFVIFMVFSGIIAWIWVMTKSIEWVARAHHVIEELESQSSEKHKHHTNRKHNAR